MTRKLSIPDSARSGGLLILAPSGWGKSRLLGRSVCYQDCQKHIGQVVIDVVGPTIDNLLHKIVYQPAEVVKFLGPRVGYVNMNGMDGYVWGFPLLSPRHPNESPHTTIQRLLDVIVKTDRNLKTASIQGFNRLAPLLTSLGIVLIVLEEPLYKVFDLLDNPRAWQPRLASIARRSEAREAVADLQAFFALPLKTQAERTDVLRNKLSFLKLDPVNKAMFSAPVPSVDWERISREGLTLLLDWRDVTNDSVREFQTFALWESLLSYIRQRKRTDPPLGLVIDELSFFVNNTDNLNVEMIAADFEQLVTALKLNRNIWLTVCSQELKQLPERMQKACLTMGNHLYGPTTDEETASSRAQRFDPLNPYQVKHTSLHWGVVPITYPGGSVSQFTERRYGITGESKQFMPLTEQRYSASQKYKFLLKDEWFFGGSEREGDIPRRLTRITTRNLDPGQFVEEELVAELRLKLMQRDGVKMEDVSAGLAASPEPPIIDSSLNPEIPGALSGPARPGMLLSEPLPEED